MNIKKKKMLVVDDELEFLEIMRLRLEASGYEVITASSGKEALEKVREAKPDGVMLDILMPEVDGLDVLAQIRAIDKNLPVFMLTAFSNEERFKLANEFNATGFIVKTNDLKKEISDITDIINLADKYKKSK